MNTAIVSGDGLDHSNRQGMYLGVTITFTVVSTVMVLMRVYTRAMIVRSFGNDDWAIIAAMISMITFCTISCLYIYYGYLGYHSWDFKLTPERKLVYHKVQITNQLLYNPVLTLSKASILLFYLRITPSVFFHRVIWTTMAFIVALAVAIFFSDLMQCTPIAFFWDKDIAGGHCIDGVMFYFSTAGISTFTDLWILVMPMPMVWRLHLPLKQRVILVALFALGGVVCLMSVLRLVSFYQLYFVTKDPSYSNASLWSPLECNMAIICASLPSFRPLIAHYYPRWLSSTGLANYRNSGSDLSSFGKSGLGSKTGRQIRNSFSMAEMGTGARSNGVQSQHENDSEECIMDHTGVAKGDIIYVANERKSSSFDTSKGEVEK